MFKNYNQNQVQLLPANLNESIPADHLARLINQTVDGMDTSLIEQTYSFQGQHAYHPKMLIKVLVYGYSVGIRSSRKLADRLGKKRGHARGKKREARNGDMTRLFSTWAAFTPDSVLKIIFFYFIVNPRLLTQRTTS